MVIWEANLDDTYICKVTRKGENVGVLTVHDSQGVRLFKEDVSFSFNAMFGPDASDIENWQSLIVDVIDAYVLGRTDE